MRRRRVLISIATLVVFVVMLFALFASELLLVGFAQGTSSDAPALPACNGGWLAEGFTYRFRDPHRGEMVEFHRRGEIGGPITPDPAGGGSLAKRVIGIPGDTVVGRHGRVLVDGKKADDIPTSSFSPFRLDRDEYFVMGDNRSYSYDSRDAAAEPT